MVELDIVTNIISTLIECTIYTAILNAYWKYESKYRYVVRCFRWCWGLS